MHCTASAAVPSISAGKDNQIICTDDNIIGEYIIVHSITVKPAWVVHSSSCMRKVK